jgi:hypothetical protein
LTQRSTEDTEDDEARSGPTDLADLEYINTSQEQGYPVHIMHPKTGKPLNMTVVVAGPDSKRARRASQKGTDAAIRQQRVKRPSSADIQESYLRQLAETCISWEGFVNNGQTLEFSVDNAVLVFRKFPFIREQVDAAAGDRANFIPA